MTDTPREDAVEEALRQLRDHFMLPSISQQSIDILEATITSLRSEVAALREVEKAAQEFCDKGFDDENIDLAVYYWRAVVPIWQMHIRAALTRAHKAVAR